MLKALEALGLMLVVLALAACDSSRGPRLRAIDLLKQFGAAETRPVSGRFEMEDRECGGQSHGSLAVPPTSRVIWPLRLPERAVFATQVAVTGPPGASAAFRVGISDDRIYEPLATQTVSASDCARGWVPIEVDLGRYSGWKFSIFYQPARREWRLVLGVNAAAGAPERAYWALPGIETDARAAQRFRRR
ncbi:MAG TPA: hypothetical protein VJ813_10455 [Vicinamibacterales bacterium]|nr:hypothetical protein [Vicinamibacterales bacterium]